MNLITDEGKYYLYRHIRLDKIVPFYIGVGTKLQRTTHKGLYQRAYAKSHRNIFWRRIVNKTQYRVEILLESDDFDFIIKKEKEFNTLYGRRDKNTGTLCNLNGGGQSRETKGIVKGKSVCVYSKDGNFINQFSSMEAAARFIKGYSSAIRECLSKNPIRKSSKGFYFSFEKKDNLKIFKKRKLYKQQRLVMQFDKSGIPMCCFFSLKEAAEETGINRKVIEGSYERINHVFKKANPYIWRRFISWKKNTVTALGLK